MSLARVAGGALVVAGGALAAVVGCGSDSGGAGSPFATLVGTPGGGSQESRPREQPATAPGQGACADLSAPDGACPPAAACSRIDFAPAVTYPVSFNNPAYLAVADFNGDMVADVAVAKANVTSVDVLLAVGDGTLAAAAAYPAGGRPRGLVSGDFDGDTVADLVVSSGDTAPIQWLRGNGDGSFQAPVATPLTGGSYLFNRGELNGDNQLDLVGASFGSDPAQLFLGDGDGTFTAGSSRDVAHPARSIFVVDVDGNTLPDIVVSTDPGTGAGEVAVLPVAASGVLGAPITYAMPASGEVRPGDFDGDGRVDLIGGEFGEIGVLFGTAGGFAPAAPIAIGAREIGPIRTANFDGAGTSDVVLGDRRGPGLAIYSGETDRSFRLAGAYALPAGPLAIARADVNGDGLLDVIAALESDPGAIAVLLQRAPAVGCFGIPRSLPACPPQWPTRCEQTAQCCSSGTTCTAEGCDGATPLCDSSSFACADGRGCCPIGYACVDDYACEYVGQDPPAPPDCSGWCPTGTVCTTDDTCCPDDYPVACGSACCLAGATCDGGTCGCPGDAPPCGDVCCGSGATCVDGECVADCPEAEFPRSCGASCCADGVDCIEGECTCPSGYVPACAAADPLAYLCCLDGAPCTDGVCGCPDGRPVCGDQWCCNPGYACNGSECVESGGDGSCPSFDDLCSCSGCMAGTVVTECGCPTGTSQSGGEIGCGPGSTTGCVQCLCP